MQAGEIGYVVTNLKSTREAKVGDTITLSTQPASEQLPGYRDVQPFVYAGFFPESNEYYQELKDAIEKLSLSDSALQFAPENSPVLGFGVRIGFLGLLHMDIVRERLEREYDLELVVTNPSTDYQVVLLNGEELDIKSAAELPDPAKIREIREPWIKGEIVVPQDYVGPVIQLISAKRGLQKNISYVEQRALVSFEAPLANLLTDFYDQLKSLTSGYGSFNYELDDYRVEDLVRLDFYVAGDIVSALSIMVHRSEAQSLGRETVDQTQRNHSAPKLPGCSAGGHRRQVHRPRRHQRFPQRRHHRTLRRRRLPQKESPGQTSQGQKTHEALWQSRHSSRSLHRDAEARLISSAAAHGALLLHSIDY